MTRSRLSSMNLRTVEMASWPKSFCQRISLVDEQNPVQRVFAGIERFGSGLAYISGDQPFAVDLDDMAATQHADSGVNAPERPRDHRLAHAGGSIENHVQAHRSDR